MIWFQAATSPNRQKDKKDKHIDDHKKRLKISRQKGKHKDNHKKRAKMSKRKIKDKISKTRNRR
jgi:hypothetical protein